MDILQPLDKGKIFRAVYLETSVIQSANLQIRESPQPFSSSSLPCCTMTIEDFWTSLDPGYQKHIQAIEQSDKVKVAFPLVITPKAPDSEGSKDAILREISRLAAQPDDLSVTSPLRRLLDAHGGAIHFRNLPLGSTQDFSDFITVLVGTGPYGWKPHIHKGSEVPRKPLAEHVITADE